MDIVLIVVTLLSLAVAATMSVVALRVVRDERRRSEARVAALAADICSTDVDLALATGAGGASSSGSMFTYMQPVTSLPRLGAVVLAGALVVGAGAALLAALGRGGDASASSGSQPGAAAVGSHSAVPAQTDGALELVALGHERDQDQLTVRGVVRNPLNGSTVNQVTAVVLLYNRAGEFISTGRALVQAPALGAGSETTFVVTIPGAGDVERYRVSFRSEDRVISHVDIRS